MKSRRLMLYANIVLLTFILSAPSAPAANLQTFTGTVGDAVCGAKHDMEGDDRHCLRVCIQRGSKYDLVVGDKVYVLEIKDQSIVDALDKLSDHPVKVKGVANGDTIEVESVAAAK
ncbi:MAG TPA: hypothetical protein VMQ17_20525 [Candidatus Sulfotelmatobacter sp.]|nr:hypothetical protein [Candidatus Sulfotelmatobacter sp.]